MAHEVSKCQNFLQEKWSDITNHKDLSNTRSIEEEILEEQIFDARIFWFFRDSTENYRPPDSDSVDDNKSLRENYHQGIMGEPEQKYTRGFSFNDFLMMESEELQRKVFTIGS